MPPGVFSIADLAPAIVHWDKLILDPDRPLEPQIDDSYEELLLAEFPNGVSLDVEWRDEFRSRGFFVVTLVQNPDYWEPIASQKCDSLVELKRTVTEFVNIARHENKRYLLSRAKIDADEIWLNRLVLNPDAPLNMQANLLAGELFEASYLIGGRILTIGWLPPHDPSGEFVIRSYHSETEWKTEASPRGMARYRERNPESWQLISEKRCKSVPELMAIVTKMANEARSTGPGDRM